MRNPFLPLLLASGGSIAAFLVVGGLVRFGVLWQYQTGPYFIFGVGPFVLMLGFMIFGRVIRFLASFSGVTFFMSGLWAFALLVICISAAGYVSPLIFVWSLVRYVFAQRTLRAANGGTLVTATSDA